MSESNESAQAGREARDAIVGRRRFKSASIAEAMRRYLGAATYGELRREKSESSKDSTPHRTHDEDPCP